MARFCAGVLALFGPLIYRHGWDLSGVPPEEIEAVLRRPRLTDKVGSESVRSGFELLVGNRADLRGDRVIRPAGPTPGPSSRPFHAEGGEARGKGRAEARKRSRPVEQSGGRACSPLGVRILAPCLPTICLPPMPAPQRDAS